MSCTHITYLNILKKLIYPIIIWSFKYKIICSRDGPPLPVWTFRKKRKRQSQTLIQYSHNAQNRTVKQPRTRWKAYQCWILLSQSFTTCFKDKSRHYQNTHFQRVCTALHRGFRGIKGNFVASLSRRFVWFMVQTTVGRKTASCQFWFSDCHSKTTTKEPWKKKYSRHTIGPAKWTKESSAAASCGGTHLHCMTCTLTVTHTDMKSTRYTAGEH